MPLDAIRKRILSDSEAKAEEVRAGAEAEAHKILSEARSRAKEIEKQAEADAHAEAARLEKESEAGLEITRNSIILEAQGATVDREKQGVERAVRSILSSDYLPMLLKSGVEQFAAASDEKFIVRTKKRNSRLVESLKLTPKYDETEEGFALESHDGKMRLVVSPDSLIENSEDSIRKEISGLLFGKSKASAEKMEKPAKKEKMKKHEKAEKKKHEKKPSKKRKKG
jgi:vacuolar-type H+-ATPase subunit E/Vma4